MSRTILIAQILWAASSFFFFILAVRIGGDC
jgi:hypothetical protein